MVDFSMKKNLLFLLLFLFNHLLQSLSEKSNGVCVSPGGRFSPYLSDGKSPRKLSSTGEANEECLHLWELLGCSICNSNVGVKPGPPLIRPRFAIECTKLALMHISPWMLYKSGKVGYIRPLLPSHALEPLRLWGSEVLLLDAIILKLVLFATFGRVLAPCGVDDFVCGRASEWISNGSELCRAAGFAVQPTSASGLIIEETSCYGGKVSLYSIAEPWKKSQNGSSKKDSHFGLLDDFQQWVRDMPFTEQVSWAVGGLVLTAGLFFMRLVHFHPIP